MRSKLNVRGRGFIVFLNTNESAPSFDSKEARNVLVFCDRKKRNIAIKNLNYFSSPFRPVQMLVTGQGGERQERRKIWGGGGGHDISPDDFVTVTDVVVKPSVCR